jgi:predicted TIM-barrel fold metal-dependent hydrolase
MHEWHPRGAIDCHVHVFDPAKRSYPPEAGYIPTPGETQGLEKLVETLTENGIDRAVLVQPSAYATDNSVLLSALKESSRRLVGVAVVRPDIGEADLAMLRRAGVVGLRVNLQNSAGLFFGSDGATMLDRLAAKAGMVGLALHLQCDARILPDVLPHIAQARALILDHLGFPQLGSSHSETVGRLADDRRVFVKLSGAFRLSRMPAPFPDLDTHVAAILDAFGPERCVWGSDWPFINTRHPPKYAETLALLSRWVPDACSRAIILRDAPTRLFFGERT